MGLGTVELVMDLEDKFGIFISDADAEKIETIGDTVNYIAGQLISRGSPTGGGCWSAHTFYHVRRELMTEAGVGRRDVRLESRIEDLIPEGRGRAVWKDIVR